MNDEQSPKPSLDYATPRRRKRLVHPVYLAVTLACFAVTASAYLFAARNQASPWSILGCCAIPLFTFLGFLFLYGTLAAPLRIREERDSKQPTTDA